MTTRFVSLSIAALLLTGTSSLALAGGSQGHQHGHEAQGHGDHGHGAMTMGRPGRVEEVDRVVAVKLGDNHFTPETIEIKKGETVKFELDNQGRLLHEFNIGTAAMHAAHQKEMLAMMQAGMLTPTGMQPMEHGHHGDHDMAMMKHDDPNSVLLEPGQQKTLIWTFDADTQLQFACNVPGHYESGMWGAIDIER